MVFAVASLLAAVISVAVALYAWRHPTARGSRPFGLVSLGAAIWQLGHACELSSTSLGSAVLWDNLQFLGMAIIPPAFLLFALQYSGSRAGSARWLWALLAVEPIVTTAIVWTNPLHGLIRGPLFFTRAGPVTILSYSYGPWMWLSIFYAYSLVILSIALLIRRLFEIPRTLRSQIQVVIVGALIPWVGTILTVAGLLPIAGRNLDLAPLTFLAGNLIWFWALFRHRLFSIVPVAYETLVGAIVDGVIMVDDQRRVVLMNRGAERIVGCSAAQATGRPVEDVFAVWPELAACLTSRRPQRVEIAMGEGDARRTYDVEPSAVSDPGDTSLGLVVLMRDVTERRRAEAELAAARDVALEASRLKSEFLATMSHEIRTPLSAIIGMSEILLDTELSDDQREFAGIIESSSRALLALLSDILDFSKIEAGKLTLAHERFCLRGLVEGAAGLLAPRAREKGLTLRTAVSPELPEGLIGDEMRLRQVLLNLISNAVKFTERGEVVVRAELERGTAATVSVRFSVADTGIGLSEAARRRLFQPFTQADGSTTRKYGGTGLGLAISQRLTELMGGEICVESVEGRGSTFWFTAPLVAVDAPGTPNAHDGAGEALPAVVER